MSFKPYANEADVLTIGRLTIENRLDRITISGDIDLTADQAGRAHARDLSRLRGDVIRPLEAQKALPQQLPPAVVATVDNPFA